MTTPRTPETFPKLVAGLMLLFAIGFVTDILSRSMGPGVLFGGDDTVHMAYTLAVQHLIETQGWPFGWVYQFGLGAPGFIFRPPGFHLTVHAIHLLTLHAFPLMWVHKLAYLLSLALYPAALFYMMRSFRFSPLTCGIAALLAIGPISSWGHTIDAYYQLGLAKQAFACLAVPVALGKLHGIVERRERLLPAAVIFAFMFVNHPYMGWGTCLFGGLYFVVQACASFDLRRHFVSGLRFTVMVVGGMLLVAFWLFPFYSASEIQRTTPYSAGIRQGFTVLVDTATSTAEHYVRGSLLDAAATREEVFGHDLSPHWEWKNIPGGTRWPVLSWGSLLGAGILLLGFRSRRNAYFLAAWLASLVLFLGPDDVQWLRWIPFQEQVQYVHLVPFLELFATALAAIGLGGLAEGLTRLATARLPERAVTARGLVLCGITLVVAVPPAANVLEERARQAAAKAQTRNFEVDRDGQTDWSLRSLTNQQLEEATDWLAENLAPFQRFYGSPTRTQAGTEIFHFTLAPAYIGRPNLISPLFGGFFGGVNNLAAGHFRPTLWKSAVLTDLFQVEALITTRANEKHYPLPRKLYRPAVRNGRWIVYQRRESPSPFHFTDVPPLLVVGDPEQWRLASRRWGESVRDLPDLRGVTFLVWERESRRGREDAQPLGTFSGIYLADPEIDLDAFFAEGELAAYLEAGGAIHCRLPLEEADFECPVAAKVKIPKPRPATGTGWSLLSMTQEEFVHRAQVAVPRPGFLFHKAAFYRGWAVTADGEPRPNVSVSPGFNGVHLPAGEHAVEFRYTGANNGRLGNWVSALTLLALLGASLGRRGPRTQEDPADDRAPPWVLLPSVVLALLLVIPWVDQAVLKRPVPQFPLAWSETEAFVIRARWSPIAGDDVTCDVQVAGADGSFDEPLFEELGVPEPSSGRIPVEPGEYRWRVRCSADGKTHRWSRTVPFRIL